MLADRVRMGSKLSGVLPLILYDNGIGFDNWVEKENIGGVNKFDNKTDHIYIYTYDAKSTTSRFSIATRESINLSSYKSIVITYSQGPAGVGLIDNINQPYSEIGWLDKTSIKKTHSIDISNYTGKKHIVFRVSASAILGYPKTEVKIYKVEVLP